MTVRGSPLPWVDQRSDGERHEPAIAQLVTLASEIGADAIRREAIQLGERVAEGRFFVACVGQVKRGKSTVLNALVGAPVLPTGLLPVTAVPTVVRYGQAASARVETVERGWSEVPLDALVEYVAEDRNPDNRKRVLAVEVRYPSPLLARGLCLLDTPGVGSVFEGNTRATLELVPRIDAAIVVIGVDPPLSADELLLVGQVNRQVADLIVVMSKADRFTEHQREEAAAFAQRVLEQRLGRRVSHILQVSATERLAGTGALRDWPTLVAELEQLAVASGRLVRAAEERGVRRLVDRLVRELDERHGALTRPVEESERRIAHLKACTAQAERALGDLGYLLAAEQGRLATRFAEEREAFLARALPAAKAELGKLLNAPLGQRDQPLREYAIQLAQEVYRRWLDRWNEEVQPLGEQLYREAAERFTELANGFLDRLASSGEPALAALPRMLGPEAGFRVGSRFYPTELLTLTARSPLDWLLDVVRLRAAALRAVTREAGNYLERLLRVNASRVTGDLDERVLESRRRLESEIRSYLLDLHQSAQRALEVARVRWVAGADARRAELERLDALRRQASTLQLLHPEEA
jgi:GTP-binding protein EngB required for normal cell division